MEESNFVNHSALIKRSPFLLLPMQCSEEWIIPWVFLQQEQACVKAPTLYTFDDAGASFRHLSVFILLLLGSGFSSESF